MVQDEQKDNANAYINYWKKEKEKEKERNREKSTVGVERGTIGK